jgi:hypothetical protein
VSKLKQHLRNIKGGEYNEKHPKDDEQWDQFANQQFLRTHTRPGPLSHEENLKRRADTQKRNYIKNREKILQQQKDRRARVNSTLQITKDLGNAVQSLHEESKTIKATTAQIAAYLRTIYGAPEKYRLESFVNLTEITLATFPRLVAFYLDITLIPTPNLGTPHVTPFLDNIPGESHFRQMSLILHPDKGMSERRQQALNAGFDLWRPVLRDKALAQTTLPDLDEESLSQFSQQGRNYQIAVEMLVEYSLALNEIAELLRPEKLTMGKLSSIFFEFDTQFDKSTPELVEDLVKKALNAPAIPIGRPRGRNANPRRDDSSETSDNLDSSDEGEGVGDSESPSNMYPTERRFTRSQASKHKK